MISRVTKQLTKTCEQLFKGRFIKNNDDSLFKGIESLPQTLNSFKSVNEFEIEYKNKHRLLLNKHLTYLGSDKG